MIHHYHPKLLPLRRIHETTGVLLRKHFDLKHGQKEVEKHWTSAEKVSAAGHHADLEGERSNFVLANQSAAALGCVPIMMPKFDTTNIPEEKLVITFTTYLCKRLLDSSTEIRATLKIQRIWLQFRSGRRFREVSQFWLQVRSGRRFR